VVRGGGRGAEPHPGAERGEVSEFLRIARRPAAGEPLVQGGTVRFNPDQVHRVRAEFGHPGPPAGRVMDLPGKWARQQDRAAIGADFPGHRGHSGIFVPFDVLVIPRALTLARWPPRGPENGRDKGPVHGVFVQQRRARPERAEQQCGHGALA
jgi:hypothetical protein